MSENIYDVIVLGSGPAGFTAAIYSVRAGRKTMMIAGTKWGGQLMLTTLVENYPGFAEGIQGPDLMVAMRKQTENLGVAIINTDFTSSDFKKRPFEISADGKIFKTKSVIVATGADSIWLNIPGEMQLRGKGVSTCATCDAFFFRNKDVIVVGGGDSAMEEAMFLAQMTTSVTIIHRRDSFRASKAMQNKIFKSKKIKIIWNTILTKYNGTEKLESVNLKNNKTGKEQTMKIDGVFVAVGHKPNSGQLRGLDIDSKGYVKRNEVKDENGILKYRSATNIPGVFTGGDVHDYRYRQAITAAAFGCMAAMDADKWLMELDK